MSWYGQWRPYVPVSQRRAEAVRFGQRLSKKEKRPLAPVRIEGRQIATTFWGQAWMDNLEAYSDFANRLPRGRTYVRNGSVIDLVIHRGQIQAVVSGSQVYQVQIEIDTLSAAAWTRIKRDCANSIDSLLDLLGAKFDQGVMERLTQPGSGLFPRPNEIRMKCSCPDWAVLCKHVAAVMYGIGSRLDHQPELLFTLRDVNHTELIRQATTSENLDRLLATGQQNALGSQDLGELFGIDLEQEEALDSAGGRASARARRRPARPQRQTVAVRKRVTAKEKRTSGTVATRSVGGAGKPPGRVKKAARPARVTEPPAPPPRAKRKPAKPETAPPADGGKRRAGRSPQDPTRPAPAAASGKPTTSKRRRAR